MSSQKELFYPAKIFDANENPDKRWFVYFFYYNEITGKMDRIKVYQDYANNLVNGNRIKSLKEKKLFFSKLATLINHKLSSGWSPDGEGYTPRNSFVFISTSKAIETVINSKKNYLRETSFNSFNGHMRRFKQYLEENCLSMLSIKEITKRHISEFLISLQVHNNISNRTVNNFLIDIRSAFSKMIELEYIDFNPTMGIKLKNAPRNKNLLFEKVLLEKVSNYMLENDPYLGIFCKFIWMGFRPNEIVKIKCRDIDLNSMQIRVLARNEKSGHSKSKRIFKIFEADVKELLKSPHRPDDFLFSSKGHPHPIETHRDYFTKRFKKIKDHFGLIENYTMYGLRHTMAVQLVKSGESMANIMKITGHKTLQAFQHYISEYLDEPAQDVGEKFEYSI